MKSFAVAALTLCVAVGCDRAPAAGLGDSPRDAPAEAAVVQTPVTKTAAIEPESEPEPEPPSLETRAEALVQTMEALAELHTASAKDCDGLATGLKGFAAEHHAELAAQTPELHAWIDGHDATRARLRTAMGTVMTGGITCRDNAGVQAVYATLTAGK